MCLHLPVLSNLIVDLYDRELIPVGATETVQGWLLTVMGKTQNLIESVEQ